MPIPLFSYTTFAWIVIGIACIVLILSCRNTPRTKGRIFWYHFIFLLTIPCLLLLIPQDIQCLIFTPLGIALIATIYPIYESIQAVCTIDNLVVDDTWLQYWITQIILLDSGILLFWTAYHANGQSQEKEVLAILYKISFFYTVWLVLPFTDGSTLILDGITSLCLKPLLIWIPKVFKNRLVGVVTNTLMNLIHLIALWYICFELNSQWIPVTVIAITTLYPLIASLISLSTTDKSDTYFWLAYWSLYGIFILVGITIASYYTRMDMQSYYLVFAVLMIYLMLPLFRGAEQVFRSILVPWAGLDEMLIIYDSHRIKMATMQRLPTQRKKHVLRMISTSFFEAHEVCDEDEWLRSGDAYDDMLAFKQGYHSIPQRFSEI